MKPTIPQLSFGQSLRTAISAMDEVHIGFSVITDDQGELVGALVDGDIRRALIAGCSLDEPIDEHVTRDPLFIRENYTSTDVVKLLDSELFKRRRPNLIPVVTEDGIFVSAVEVSALSDSQTDTASPSSENVLILGGAGYIGARLARRMLAKKIPVTVMDSMEYGDFSLESIKDNPLLTIVKGDTRHIEELVPLIRDASAVVHLAELVGDPLCAMDPQLTMEINYLATMSIAQVCRHLQVNRFIYMSSCSVYGSSADPEKILHEGSELAPVSLYARTKINCEKALLEMAADAFSPCIFRLGTVFGLSPRPRFDLVVNTLTAKGVAEGAVGIFGGEQWRPHIHVDDVARAIEVALEAPLAKIANQVFNVAGDNLTINDVGELVAQALPGLNVNYETTNQDIRNYRVTSQKIKDALGFEAAITVQDGIAEIAEAIRSGEVKDYNDTVYHNYRTFEGRTQQNSNCTQS